MHHTSCLIPDKLTQQNKFKQVHPPSRRNLKIWKRAWPGQCWRDRLSCRESCRDVRRQGANRTNMDISGTR